jgi:hypothetical protein
LFSKPEESFEIAESSKNAYYFNVSSMWKVLILSLQIPGTSLQFKTCVIFTLPILKWVEKPKK